MIRLRRRRALAIPDQVGGNPRVDLDAPAARVRLGQQVRERIKTLR